MKQYHWRLPLIAILFTALMSLASACAPSIPREQLTPTVTLTITALPTRTPDPKSTATKTPRPSITPRVTPTPITPSETAAVIINPEISQMDGLVFESYLLGSGQGVDLRPESLDQNQFFYERIPANVFARRADLWQAAESLPIDRLNLTLPNFGYRLEKSSGEVANYQLFEGTQLLRDNITRYGALQVNPSGTDFILPLTVDNYEVWVLQSNRLELWFAGKPRFLPVFAGNDVAELSEPGAASATGTLAVSVLIANQPVFALPITEQGAQGCPIENFEGWGSSWVLEAEGEIVVDGEKRTELLGLQQAFDWQALGGREFFLFQQDGAYGVSYDGQVLPVQYDEIVRWSCVDQIRGGFNFSARGNHRIAGFFARKDGNWYYIEVLPS